MEKSTEKSYNIYGIAFIKAYSFSWPNYIAAMFLAELGSGSILKCELEL